jgi:hypothetical protein
VQLRKDGVPKSNIKRVKNGRTKYDKKLLISLLSITIFALLVQLLFMEVQKTPSSELVDEDIYYIWLEGKEIINHRNPYSSVLVGDMRTNNKYPTYLPFYYLLSTSIQFIGFGEFNSWVIFIRFFSGFFT